MAGKRHDGVGAQVGCANDALGQAARRIGRRRSGKLESELAARQNELAAQQQTLDGLRGPLWHVLEATGHG